MQRRTIILIQKSRSRELTLDLIPHLTASLVGFMYLIGGIKPGANSLHVCGGKKWWCVCVCVDGPAFRCHGAAVKLFHPPNKKIGKIRRERVLLATSLRQKFFAKELNFHKKAGKKN